VPEKNNRKTSEPQEESRIRRFQPAFSAKPLNKRMEDFFWQIPAQIAMLSGPDLVYDFVNLRYQQLLPGRELLGKPLLEAVPELKSHPVLQSMYSVLLTGKPVEGKELLIALTPAGGGEPENYYVNFVHQAYYGEDGSIGGLITFSYNVTELVKARKDAEQSRLELLAANNNLLKANQLVLASNEKLRVANQNLYETQIDLLESNMGLEKNISLRTSELLLAQQDAEHQRDQLHKFFMQSPTGICLLEGPDFIYELVNPSYQQLLAGRNLLGKPLLTAVPEIEGQPIVDKLKEVYHTGETYEGEALLIPLARTDNGPVEDRYFNFNFQARLDPQGKINGLLIFVFEVTGMVIAEQKVQGSERHLNFLLNSMPQQLWTARPDGLLDFVNEVVCVDFGKTAAEITGAGWQGLIHPDDLDSSLQAWAIALKQGTTYETEFRLRLHDGTYKWYLGRAVPYREDGLIKLWMGTNTDIDQQKSNEQKKDEFLSIASHELKTPLTSMKAFNQLMLRSNDVGKLHQFAEKTAENITKLEKLIRDLLDVTKINAGKINYTMTEFDFSGMLRKSVETVQYTAPAHQLQLESCAEIFYTGDKFRLEQVVENFLTNAIKYSPGGGKVIISCKSEHDNIVVAVRDFGIGIAENELKHIFERYYRVDNTDMRFEGLGLGLFISSEILKRHHGSFWIESEPGKGSVFYFRLPISPAEELKPVVDKGDFYQDPSITVSYNAAARRIDADWTGFQSFESVKHGGQVIMEMLIRFKCEKVVNDNRHVLGTWSEAADWARKEWFPMMENVGLKYFAWIYSSSAFSQLSAQKSIDFIVNNVITQFFTDISDGEAWIDKK
jgi:PAS domain S-box-containing protein